MLLSVAKEKNIHIITEIITFMYSYLAGTLLSLEDDKATILIEGTGLGLEVLLSPHALGLHFIGTSCAFPVYHHRTENSELLFGFENEEEKRIFQKLLKVNGVGGKTALTILGLGLESIVRAIELRDDSLLASVPGIGKKTAQKIIVELAGSLNLESLRGGKQFPERDPNTLHLITSLVQMGYEKSRVENIIGELDAHLSLEEKTREVIRQLSQKS